MLRTLEIPDVGGRDPFSVDAIAQRQRPMTDAAQGSAAADHVRALEEHGYVVLRDVIAGAELDAARAALDEINARTRSGQYEFEGFHTHRAYCVVSQTRAFDALIMHPAVLAVVEGYFGEAPQLSASMGMTLYEGQAAQPLHRDTGHFPIPWPRPPLEVNAIWAFDDFTRETGATRFVPQSHRIPDETRPDAETVDAQMRAGSVFLYDGSLWHGGGTATAPGTCRRSINNIYIRQWLRQQDNMYLSIPPAEVLSMPKLMQRLLGYSVYGYTLGVVDGGSPTYALERRLSAAGTDASNV